MAVRGIHDSGRYTAMEGIRQWEIYGSGKVSKEGHLSKTVLIA
jgi:hypothetical protein